MGCAQENLLSLQQQLFSVSETLFRKEETTKCYSNYFDHHTLQGPVQGKIKTA